MFEPTDPAGDRPHRAGSARRAPGLAGATTPGDLLTGGADQARGTGGADQPRGRGRGLEALGSPDLSHELRTPLNAILGNTELLLDGSAGPLSNEARACLGDIQAAGQRLLRQVQVLLDLCHARFRPAITDDQPLDLIALLRAAQAAAPRLGPGLGVLVMPAEARCIVRGDPHSLRALALALVDLRLAAGAAAGPLLVTLEQCSSPVATATVRLGWHDFHPDQVPALPIALIEAIVDLHDGTVALTGHGLQLDWPASRVVQVGPLAAGRARDRNGL